jgi:hypothetical protein
MNERDRKDAWHILLDVDKNLQLSVGGAAQFAIDRLTPHRAAIPGTTMDEALDQMRSILIWCDELQNKLRQARQLLRPRK